MGSTNTARKSAQCVNVIIAVFGFSILKTAHFAYMVNNLRAKPARQTGETG